MATLHQGITPDAVFQQKANAIMKAAGKSLPSSPASTPTFVSLSVHLLPLPPPFSTISFSIVLYPTDLFMCPVCSVLYYPLVYLTNDNDGILC